MRETLLQFLNEISERANKLSYNDLTPIQKNSICNTIQDAVGYIKKDVVEYLDYLEEENKRLYKENQELLKMTHDAIYNGEHIDFESSYPNTDNYKEIFPEPGNIKWALNSSYGEAVEAMKIDDCK